MERRKGSGRLPGKKGFAGRLPGRTALLFVLFSVLFCVRPRETAFAQWTGLGIPSSVSYASGNSDRVIILAGDSRTMYLSVYSAGSDTKDFVLCWVNGGSISVIGKNGILTPLLEEALRRYPEAPVVFNLGYNGNSYPRANAGKLIREYSRWEKKYPGHHFYIANVGPAAASGKYSDENAALLNRTLEKEYGRTPRYIDLYGSLLKSATVSTQGKGFLPDRKHYGAAAGRRILRTVRRRVSEGEGWGR